MKLRRKKAQQNHAPEPEAVDDPMAIAQRILTQGLDSAPSRRSAESSAPQSQLLTDEAQRTDDFGGDDVPDDATMEGTSADDIETAAEQTDFTDIDTSELPGWDFNSLDDEIASLTPLQENDLSDPIEVSAQVAPTTDADHAGADRAAEVPTDAPVEFEGAAGHENADLDVDASEMDEYANWDVDALDREILALTPHSGDYLPDPAVFDEDADLTAEHESHATVETSASAPDSRDSLDDLPTLTDDVSGSDPIDDMPGWDLDAIEEVSGSLPSDSPDVLASPSADDSYPLPSDDPSMQSIDDEAPSSYTIAPSDSASDPGVDAALAELPGWDSLEGDSSDDEAPSYSIDTVAPDDDMPVQSEEPSPWVFSATDPSTTTADAQDSVQNEWGLDDEPGWDFSTVDPPADSPDSAAEASASDAAAAADGSGPTDDPAPPDAPSDIPATDNSGDATGPYGAELPDWDANTDAP